ncbi:MAG: PmoA family protein [Planctomycetota bacterium]
MVKRTESLLTCVQMTAARNLLGNVLLPIAISTLLGVAWTTAEGADSWTLSSETSNTGSGTSWGIHRNGDPVTVAHADLKGTPGLYPLYSPSGLALTRSFPIEDAGSLERLDHDHHRSVWFTHGLVNDVDFWIDDDKPNVGRVFQIESDARHAAGGVIVESTNEWRDPDSIVLLTEQRSWQFSDSIGDTVIDFQITLAAVDRPVFMGDTKEGSLGIRVAASMKVDAGFGGRITNAEGLTDKATWSKASPWVDYSGPIAVGTHGPKPTREQISSWPTAGITIMAHPNNDVTPTRWHVRTYGLFAANPFGRHHFGLPAYDGVEIVPSKPLHLSYRIVLHDGPLDVAKTQRHFDAFSAKVVAAR